MAGGQTPVIDAESGPVSGQTRAHSLTLLLAAGLLIGTITQFLVGTLAPSITRDLDLGASQFGLIVSLLFAVGCLGAASSQWLVQRLGLRLAFMSVQWLVAMALTLLALVQTQSALVGSAILAGVAMGIINPITNAVIARDVNAPAQTPVVGVVQSGVQVGTLIAGLAAPAAVVLGNWDRPLLVLAAGAVLVSLAAPRLMDADWADRVAEGVAIPSDLRTLAYAFVAYAFLMAAGAAVMFAYLPLYASERLGFSDGAAGLLGAVFGAVGFAARLLFTRSRTAIGPRLGRLLVGLGMGAAGALILVALAPQAPWLTWAGAALFGATAVAWPAVLLAGVVEVGGSSLAARLTSWVFIGFYAGLLATPALFGRVVESGLGYTVGWLLAAGIFLAAAATGIGVRRRHPAGSAPPSHRP
jgi:predicted MFS family arabinose efflux permease